MTCRRRRVDPGAALPAADVRPARAPLRLHGRQTLVLELDRHGRIERSASAKRSACSAAAPGSPRSDRGCPTTTTVDAVLVDERGHGLELARRLADVDRADRNRHPSFGIGDRDADPGVAEVERPGHPHGRVGHRRSSSSRTRRRDRPERLAESCPHPCRRRSPGRPCRRRRRRSSPRRRRAAPAPSRRVRSRRP